MLQSIGVLTIAPIGGAATGLHVSCAPGFRPDGTKESRGMKCAGADLHVERLHNHTALLGPIGLQGLDEPLEARQLGSWYLAHLVRWPKGMIITKWDFLPIHFPALLC